MKQIKVRVEAVIFSQDKKILLARHEKQGKAYWVLPGGGVDFGEKMDVALLRELKEELGIKNAKATEIMMIDEFIQPENNRHVIKTAFFVEVDKKDLDTAKVVTSDEAIKEVRLFSASDITKSEEVFYPSKELFIQLLEPLEE